MMTETKITFNKETKTVQVNNGIPFVPLQKIRLPDGRTAVLDYEKERYVATEEIMSLFEHIKQRCDNAEQHLSNTMADIESNVKQLRAAHYQLAEDNKLLLKALELTCLKFEEIGMGCGLNYDDIEHWLEKAKENDR